MNTQTNTIRLIASDLDGTLLIGKEKRLPDDVIPFIREFTAKGGIFVAASGRQYANLRALFHEVADDIAYICENGCRVIYHDKVLYHAYMERQIGEEIIQDIRQMDGCEVLVSGDDTCYIEPKNPEFAEYMNHHVKNHTTVMENTLLVKEPYFKISVYHPDGIEPYAAHFEDVFGDRVHVVTSGLAWLDMMPKGITKGTGIEVLSRACSIPMENMLAVGDHFNDLEMLRLVGYPCCVDGAQSEVMDVCKYKATLANEIFTRVASRKII